MPVRMYGLGGLQHEVPLPQPGAWVKLRNVAACIINGQLQVHESETSMEPRINICACNYCCMFEWHIKSEYAS